MRKIIAGAPESSGHREGLPPAVLEKIRSRLSQREMQGLEAMFALRAAAQQVDYALSGWMADTAGSFARYQILMALWATAGKGIAHKEIVAAMRVTPATVSGLMTALEREGLVRSDGDPADRRKSIARLTNRGEAVVEKAFNASSAGLRDALAPFSAAELKSLSVMLRRFREAFALPSMPAGNTVQKS
jgi:DNA-binding MarR family transcriptional regulator